MLRSMVRLNAAGLLQFVAAGNVEGGSRAGPVDMRSLAGRCAACMRHLLPPRAAVASRLAAMLCLLSLLARATGQAAGVCAAAHPAHPLGLQASWITCRLLPSPHNCRLPCPFHLTTAAGQAAGVCDQQLHEEPGGIPQEVHRPGPQRQGGGWQQLPLDLCFAVVVVAVSPILSFPSTRLFLILHRCLACRRRFTRPRTRRPPTWRPLSSPRTRRCTWWARSASRCAARLPADAWRGRSCASGWAGERLRAELSGAGLPTCTQAPSGWYAASGAPAASYQPDQPDQPAPCLTVLKQEELDLKGISHIGGPADADKKVELKPGMLLEQDPDVRVFVMLIFSEGQSLVLGVQQHARISSQAGWFA